MVRTDVEVAMLAVFAAEVSAPAPDPAVVDPFILAIASGVVVPLVTGLVTKLGTANSVKATISFCLSGILAAVNQVITSQVWDWRQFVLLWSTTFVAHLTSYKAFWKPVGGGVDPVSKATPDIGIGPPARP